MKIYIVNIKEFNDKYRNDCSIEEFEKATEEEIIALNKESEDKFCTPEPYTLEEFVNEFNYATSQPINSDRYYLKVFN